MSPRLASLLAALLVAAGCTTTSTTTTSAAGPGPLVPPAPARPSATPEAAQDRMTASDEPESVRRGRARLELASAYFQRGQMTTALDQVKLAIQADPNSSEAYTLRGLIYANLGDQPLAEESFRRALQLNPTDWDGMHNFAWYLCQQRRYDEADAMFRRALAVPQYREQPRTLLAQGVCQASAGRLEAAEQTLQRSFELDASNPTTALNLADVLYRRGQYERARFYVRRVNARPELTNPQTLWLAARIENRLGNQQGVQDFGTQLSNRFPDSREASAFQRGAFDE
jgi:type IV pilus assembly protein PilF